MIKLIQVFFLFYVITAISCTESKDSSTSSVSHSSTRMGAYKAADTNDPLVKSAFSALLKKLDKNEYGTLTLVSAKKQVVAGLNISLTVRSSLKAKTLDFVLFKPLNSNDFVFSKSSSSSKLPTSGAYKAIDNNDPLVKSAFSALLKKLDKNEYGTLTLVSAKKQVVAGLNISLTVRSSLKAKTLDFVLFKPLNSNDFVLSKSSSSSKLPTRTGAYKSIDNNDPLVKSAFSALLKKLDKNEYGTLTLVSAKTQVVAGLNISLTVRSSLKANNLLVFVLFKPLNSNSFRLSN